MNNNDSEGVSPLNELLSKTKLSPEGLADMITYLSGDKISKQTIWRRVKEGRQGWKKLSLTAAQWVAIAQLMKIPSESFLEFLKNPDQFLDQKDQ